MKSDLPLSILSNPKYSASVVRENLFFNTGCALCNIRLSLGKFSAFGELIGEIEKGFDCQRYDFETLLSVKMRYGRRNPTFSTAMGCGAKVGSSSPS
jgi:hypothetical protein